MRVSRSSFLAASITTLTLLLSPPNYQAQQPKVLAPRRPIGPKALDSQVRQEPRTPRSMVGGLWMIDPNRKASIYLKNGLETSSLTVTPSLFLSNGAQFDLSPVTLEPSGTAVVSINDALEQKGIASYATLSGYVEVKYIWAWDPLCVTVTSVDPIHSVIFSYGLQPSAVAKIANPRIRMPKVIEGMNAVEGMWWKPEANITGFVGLSNISPQPVDGKLQTTDGANQALGEESFHLSPHSTKLLKLEELAYVAAGSAGGLRVIYTGAGDGLVISGGLEDQTNGYSANLPFHILAEPESTQTAQETYAELGLMTGAADPMMSFPAGTVFTPFSVVRNVAEKPVFVTPSLYWMQGATARSAKLTSFTLSPFQTQNLDVSSLLATAGLASFHGSVNLILESQGQSRSLLLASGSVDQKNTYVFQVPPRGVQESQAKTISYWSTGNGDDTMVTVWNPADEPQDFAFTLLFTGGHYRLPIHLEARATQTFNISEIIQNQIPDADGYTVPPTVHEGSAKIAGTHADNEEILVALDAGTYNVRKATCSYYCISCDGTASTYVFLNPFAVALGGQTTLVFEGQQNNGQVYGIGGSWTSSNTSVATIGTYNGTVSGINLGSVTMTAFLSSTAIYNSYYCAYDAYCPYYGQASGSGGGTVRQVYKSRLVSTVFSRAMACAAGTAGWDRRITEKMVDQLGQDFTYDGVSITETLSIGPNNLGLTCGSPDSQCSGQQNTYNSGTFVDEFFFCSNSCPASTAETDVTQVLYYNGVPAHNTNLIVDKCGSISWNAQ